MRKRQKLLLIIYMYAAAILGFIYVPYVQYLPNGAKRFVGHNLRSGLIDLISWKKTALQHVSIDGDLITAEILAITAVTAAAFFLLGRGESETNAGKNN